MTLPSPWNILVVMPAYNQEKTLPIVLEKISKLKLSGATIYGIVVIDDASTDNTRGVLEIFKKKNKNMNIHYVRQRVNVGPSQSILDGFREAEKIIHARSNFIIVRMDSDGDHDPDDIAKLIRPVVNEEARATVGDTSCGLSNGIIDAISNRVLGIMQGNALSTERFRQISPGFLAFDAEYLRDVINFREKYSEEYKKRFGSRDRYGVDLSTLTFFHDSLKIVKLYRTPLQSGRRPLSKIYAQGKEVLKHFKLIKHLKNKRFS